MKKVFVSGCYDMLHSGHVAFFKEASTYGELYVGIGSDKTVRELKGRDTVNSEEERLYMVKAIRYVTDAWVSKGSGIMDFEEDLRKFKPDIFIVNEDGNSPAKAELCKELGIEYIVLKRIPEPGLTPRSTTALLSGLNPGTQQPAPSTQQPAPSNQQPATSTRHSICQLPYRLDLAGTWIDQPYVNKYGPGWAITISLEPIIEYNERSGMSTSTRNAAKKIWPVSLPLEHPVKLAEMLFGWENKPGAKEEVSGAQDAIGICVPGLSRHYYANEKYWPEKIERVDDEETLSWLERHISLVTLWPREPGLDLMAGTAINKENVALLSSAADKAWEGIMEKNLEKFAAGFLSSFNAQTRMFPNMLNPRVEAVIESYRGKALAWKLSGAGAGGYLALVAEEPVPGAMSLRIRRGGNL